MADDHTPIEFSVAFNHHERPTLRILAEAPGEPGGAPTAAEAMATAHRFLRRQADRFGLSTTSLRRVWDLFATDDPVSGFVIWHSIVFRHGRTPEFKVYLNPECRGIDRAPDLVAQALNRLGLADAYPSVSARAVRPGQLGRADRLSFLALDLHDGPHARVKLYLSHHDARIDDLVRAATVVDGVDTDELAWFCRTTGGSAAAFTGRPIVGSYSFVGPTDRPAGYSLYLPIRSYVHDDREARDRVAEVLARYRFDIADLDRAITAVTRRPLEAGVGLIAHVSLRLGPPRPGVSVYLSSEAYRTHPPRPRQVPRQAPDPQPVGSPTC